MSPGGIQRLGVLLPVIALCAAASLVACESDPGATAPRREKQSRNNKREDSAREVTDDESQNEEAVTGASEAPTASYERFQTPSGNIHCAFLEDPAGLRCDAPLNPQPEPDPDCPLDWAGLSLVADGESGPTCAGDTVADLTNPVLDYGYLWSRDSMLCVSQDFGLMCLNEIGHGFFLSRARWRTF